MGRKTFEATVLHNLGHGILSGGVSAHELGEIRELGFWKTAVSPMQMGYIEANCSGNPPVDDNCSGNPAEPVNAITTEYSPCARSKLNDTNRL
jgi:hypothetical protein